ncbi:hypothetical protein BGX21_011291 [Mortierella sp. AD011]|nr:hypothetical protein BGX21_011291 [Mortierella sp. AD011]
MSEPTNDASITVLIVGAGLGGLMLGAVLERTNISYHILERATELRPLGTAIGILGTILPIFEQLGIYEELKNISLSHVSMDFYDTQINQLGSMYTENHKTVSGYDVLVTARPKLYDLLRRQVPAHKISMRKKVLRSSEEDDKVTVYCSDNSIYECSMLVGADGAYSAVRQNMYEKLEEEGNLPLHDKDGFSIGYITMVGVSNPPKPEKYPELIDNRTHFRVVVGEKSESCYVVSAPNNQLCWGLQLQLSEEKAREQCFRNSEWRPPESVDAMLMELQDFPCPFGGTMKDLFDSTPKDLISKVFLEEKVFQTWYHGRSVLIGDACHKLLPGGGQGAVMAIKDAVVLANCIYNMKDGSDKSIKAAFASYHKQRYPEAENVSVQSAIITKVMFGHKPTMALQSGLKLIGYHWWRTAAQERFFRKKGGRMRQLVQSSNATRCDISQEETTLVLFNDIMADTVNIPIPVVLIVDTGIGGLFFGAGLERASISYHTYWNKLRNCDVLLNK